MFIYFVVISFAHFVPNSMDLNNSIQRNSSSMLLNLCTLLYLHYSIYIALHFCTSFIFVTFERSVHRPIICNPKLNFATLNFFSTLAGFMKIDNLDFLCSFNREIEQKISSYNESTNQFK